MVENLSFLWNSGPPPVDLRGILVVVVVNHQSTDNDRTKLGWLHLNTTAYLIGGATVLVKIRNFKNINFS